MISIGFKLHDFIKSLSDAERVVENGAKAIFKETTGYILDQTILWTPVGNPALWKSPAPLDYEPGTLKASWQKSYENNGTLCTLFNNTPYAERVEYGWSSQAPEGMLRRAVALWPGMLNRAAFALDQKYNGKVELFNSGLFDRF